MISELKDKKSFETTIQSPDLSVIHFQADWVEQCAQVTELLDTLSSQGDFLQAKFYSCPAEDLPEISHKYNIVAVPTVMLFKSGKLLETVNGVDAIQITEVIRKNLPNIEDVKGSLEDRLKSLINKSKIMLFMKGDKTAPRCGFSRQIIEILSYTREPFETFDILSDEEVRQGLKTYSDWPTYPQLYVKGELIGGLDIVKEMVASGDLLPILRG